MVKRSALIPIERVASWIYLLRGEQVMLDEDLAELYGVPTKRLNEQVTRNLERFPEDFMFQLSREEFEILKSQIATSSWGGRRKPPRAFTEQGVAMLSVRAFVRLRRVLASNEELARKVARHDRQIAVLFEHVKALLAPPPAAKKSPIGFQSRRSG